MPRGTTQPAAPRGSITLSSQEQRVYVGYLLTLCNKNQLHNSLFLGSQSVIYLSNNRSSSRDNLSPQTSTSVLELDLDIRFGTEYFVKFTLLD